MIFALKLFGIYLFIMGLVRWKMSIGYIYFVAAILLGAVFGLGLEGIAGELTAGTTNLATIILIAITLSLAFFLTAYRQLGFLDDVISSIQGALRNGKLKTILIPTIIGVFQNRSFYKESALLTNAATEHLQLPAERKTFITYWFSSIWDFLLPLYPAVFIVAFILQLPFYMILFILIPLALSALIAGSFYSFSEKPKQDTASFFQRNSANKILLPLWPLFLITLLSIITYKFSIGINLILPAHLHDYLFAALHFMQAVLCTTFLMILFRKTDRHTFTSIFWNSWNIDLIVFIIGIMAFEQMAVDRKISYTFLNYASMIKIPFFLLVFTFALLTGLLTGNAVACVAIVFIILKNMIIPESGLDMNLLFLSLSGAFLGTLLCPLSQSFSRTRFHFNSEFSPAYRLLIMPAMTCTTILFLCATGNIIFQKFRPFF